MNLSKGIILPLLLCLSFASFGQAIEKPSKEGGFEKAEKELKRLERQIKTDRDFDSRVAAADKMLELFTETLNQEGSFEYKFDSLITVSKIYPQDSTFRIITWELYKDKSDYKYFGFIQTKDKVHVLSDRSFQYRNPEYKRLDKDSWYGALYYNIKEFKGEDKKKKYILFGKDNYKFFERRKLLEVLSFDKDGNPSFGDPVINHVKYKRDVPPVPRTYYRFFVDYFVETSITLNYNEQEDMIVYDHLIQIVSPYKGTDFPFVYVPDGSYEGFQLKKGKWEHVKKVYDQVSEKPPRPMPILDNRTDRGLFGGDE